ncbi:MAG: alanine--tRNA ligase, partial [Odoribacter sp.]|nr:alanine--tRNA ligase [Odoribacter sp.]
QTFVARVDEHKRVLTANNHSATHLLDYALRKVLGNHVEQKGSYVSSEHLRFDFSHFQKVTDEELAEVATIVNQLIRRNIPLEEFRSIPISKAQEMGAIAVFGEKYGDLVRVIKYGDSIELCGGTHVAATGQIGFFKILSESSVSAGVRRIEAITADKAEEFINNSFRVIHEMERMFKSNKSLLECVKALVDENEGLKKETEKFAQESLKLLKERLKNKKRVYKDINLIVEQLLLPAAQVKDLAFQLRGELDKLIFIAGGVVEGKPHLTVMISNSLVDDFGLNAGQIIREVAQEIKGGGGGQPFFATAGGSDPDGLERALEKAEKLIMHKIQVD